jgi:hypothetical protein
MLRDPSTSITKFRRAVTSHLVTGRDGARCGVLVRLSQRCLVHADGRPGRRQMRTLMVNI